VNQSQSIAALAAALAKAQADISGAVKDSANPFFKSKYADLESVWSACRKPLTSNGLSVIQTTQPTKQGLMLVTTLAHSSGEWIRGYMPILAKDNSAQSQGSAVTYARRYALAAIVGIYQVDDDAEAAQGRTSYYVDPRGDLGKNVDAKKKQEFIEDFKRAFDLDAEEKEIALAVRAVHERINSDQDLYIAVSDALTAKERTAIKTYLRMAKAADNDTMVFNVRGK
jgi:hypothetical protein